MWGEIMFYQMKLFGNVRCVDVYLNKCYFFTPLLSTTCLFGVQKGQQGICVLCDITQGWPEILVLAHIFCKVGKEVKEKK